MLNPTQVHYKSISKFPYHFITVLALLLFLLLILTPYPNCFHLDQMEDTQRSAEGLVVQMRKKLSLRDLDRKVRLNAVFFADKLPHKPYICNTIKFALSRFGNIGVTASNESDPDDRMFSLTVDDEEAANDILEGSPWSIMRYSVHFQKWPETMALEELQCNQITFWVQVRGVPPYMFDVENVSEMIEKFGTFIKMDDPLESEEGTYSYLRVRVLLDARDPLPTGYQLPREDGSMTWVSFSYENLSDFCFVCGRLGHTDSPRRPCPIGPDPQNVDIEYGAWMRAKAPQKLNKNGLKRNPAEPQRTRRKFPGQPIVPLQSQTTGQNLQSQGASSSHTSEQHINHLPHQVRTNLQLSEINSHIPIVHQLESNLTHNIPMSQINYPFSLSPPNPNNKVTSFPPPGFGPSPNRVPNAFFLNQNQSHNFNNVGLPWFMSQGNFNMGHPNNHSAAALASLFSSSFTTTYPYSTPVPNSVPANNPPASPESTNTINQCPSSPSSAVHGKRPLLYEVSQSPNSRKIRKFTKLKNSGSGPSPQNSKETIDGNNNVDGGGGWPTATRSP